MAAFERGKIGSRDDRRILAVGELVHADDDRVAALDAQLVLVRTPRDLLLKERDANRLRRAAELVHFFEEFVCAALEFVGEVLDVVAAG